MWVKPTDLINIRRSIFWLVYKRFTPNQIKLPKKVKIHALILMISFHSADICLRCVSSYRNTLKAPLIRWQEFQVSLVLRLAMMNDRARHQLSQCGQGMVPLREATFLVIKNTSLCLILCLIDVNVRKTQNKSSEFKQIRLRDEKSEVA